MADTLQQLQTLLQDPRLDDADRQEWLPLIGQLSEDECKEILAVFTEEIADRDALGEAIARAATVAPGTPPFPFGTLAGMSTEQLVQPTTLDAIAALINDWSARGETMDGPLEVSAALERVVHDTNLQNNKASAWSRAHELLVHARWLAVAHVKERDVLDLLRTTSVAATRMGVPLLDHLNARLAFFEDSLRGDEDRKRFLQAIRESEEQIGSTPLLYEKGGEQPPPYLKYWLQDYDRAAPPSKPRDEFTRVTYMNQSSNVRKLSQPDRDLLLRVLETFDSLAYPKVEVVSTERAPLGIPRREPQPTFTQETIARAVPDRRTLDAYAERVSKDIANKKQDAPTTFAELVSVSQAPIPQETAYGFLHLLAKQGALESVVSEQGALQDRLRMYGREQRMPKLIQALDVGGGAPVVMQALIRYVLEARAGLPRETSAAFGALVGRILKENGKTQYGGIAYYDLKTKQFRWTE